MTSGAKAKLEDASRPLQLIPEIEPAHSHHHIIAAPRDIACTTANTTASSTASRVITRRPPCLRGITEEVELDGTRKGLGATWTDKREQKPTGEHAGIQETKDEDISMREEKSIERKKGGNIHIYPRLETMLPRQPRQNNIVTYNVCRNYVTTSFRDQSLNPSPLSPSSGSSTFSRALCT
jgi:hypothetical protein